MRIFKIRRLIRNTRHFNTLQSQLISEPITEPTNPILKLTSISSTNNPTSLKQQIIPHSHSYDVTHCILFVSSYIARLHNVGGHKEFLVNLESAWCRIFRYLQPKEKGGIDFRYLLHEVSEMTEFEENIFNFKTEFQIETFNLCFRMKIIVPFLLKLSDRIRGTKYFGVAEYENLSNLFFTIGQMKNIYNYNSESHRYKLFVNLIKEMKSHSLKPTKQICLQALQTLFHENSKRGEETISLVRSIISEHPDLVSDPLVIVSSSHVSGKLDLLQATQNMYTQNCPINEYSIHELIHGILYGGELTLDSNGKYVPTFNSLTLAFNVATNEFLPHLTSKHIDLLFSAIVGSNSYKLALRFYLIIRDEGYFPSQRGFEDLMFTLSRNSLSKNSVLHIWSDICDVYYGSPPPRAYRTLLRTLSHSKGRNGVILFKRILKSDLENEGIYAPDGAHWAWDSEMCIAKIKAYSWVNSYQDTIDVVKDMKRLNIPLTPKLLETCFMPSFNDPFLKSYLTLLLQLLFKTKYPLCSSSIRKGIVYCLNRSQNIAYSKGRKHFAYNVLGKDLSFDYEVNNFVVRRQINEVIADIVVKEILDENYKFRNSDLNSYQFRVKEIQNCFNSL